MAFFGDEVIGGTEDEYENRTSDSRDYVDAYSRSKRAAEDLVLSANGKESLSLSFKYITS